jgi:hypothetical protein
MKLKKLLVLFLLGIMSFYSCPKIASADLGISPPYIRNAGLAPGSHFEQTIFIVRTDAEEDVEAKVEFSVPGADSWLKIDKTNKFVIPKGEIKFPITFSVDVPVQAAFGRYKGNIRLTTKPLKSAEGGQITLAFGALIDVDINVVAMKIVDYRIRGTKVADVEEAYKIGFINPPGIVNFSMQIENKGNVKASPTKVMLSIYDSNRTKVINTIETKHVPKVSPFSTDWVTARIPAYIQAGSYPTIYKIYRDDKVISEGEIHLSVTPKGQVEGYKGATFFDLTIADKLKLISLATIILAIVFFIGFGIYKAVTSRKGERKVREPKVKVTKKVKKIVRRVVKKKSKKKDE